MRTHHQVQFALAQLADDFALLLGRAEAAEHVKLHRKAREAFFNGVVMLLHQNGGRGQNGHLLALHHGLEGRAQGHLGLAVAHVAAQQAVHVARAFHVGLDLGHALLLVLGQLVGEQVLKLPLPGVVVAEGVARLLGASGVELGQVEGQLFEAGLDLALLPFPFLAAQAVELGSGVFGADELGHPVELVGRHVELVVSRVLNQQVITPGAVVFQLHHALEQTHAVQVVHHVVARLEVGEGGDALARGLLLAGALVGGAVDIGIADDAQPRGQVHKPLGIGYRQQQHLARDEVAVQRGAVGGGHMLRRERGLQPASARLAAGEQHHAGALLLPFGDILTQRLQPALIGHRGPGTKGDGLVRRKAAKGAHRVAQAHGGPRLEVAQQVFIGEAQVLLRVEGVAAQPCVLVRLRKSVRGGAQADLILVRPVQQHDGIVQIVGHQRRIVQKHIHPHGRGADHLSRAHAVHVVQVAFPGGARLRSGLIGAGSVVIPLRLGEQVLRGLQRVQAAQKIVQRGQPVRPRRGMLGRGGFHGVAHALFQRGLQAVCGGLSIGHEAFGGGGDARALHPRDAALADAVKAAQAVDLVVKKLDAQRVGGVGGEHVHDRAAHGALAPALHHGHALVSAADERFHQPIRRNAAPF